MKKKIFIGIGAVLTVLIIMFIYGTFINPKSPGKTTEFSNNGLDIKVTYSQPSKRGRLIFGTEEQKALQPYGKYWRLGANAATEITFSKNILFADKPVSAGTYRMYAVPGPEVFQVSLNSETGVFLAVNEPDYTKDVVKVDIFSTKAPETEKFEITFASDSAGVKMNLIWDTTQVSVPIKVQ